MPEQTLAVGDTLAQKWGKLAWTGPMGIEPDGELWAIIGPPKQGKTYLLQSNPDAFIFNFDGSPAVYPNCPAGVWPVRHGGRMLNSDGKPMSLTWAAVEKKKQELISLAERDQPRPRLIVFDTVTTMSKLLMEWIPSQMNKPDFTSCGQAGWVVRNNKIVDFGLELAAAGYGVCWSIHQVAQKVAAGDQVVKSSELYEPDLSDGLWQALHPHPSTIARVVKQVVVERPKDATGKLLPGQPVRRTVYEFRTYDPAMPHFLGTRFDMPESVELPALNPWQTLLSTIKSKGESE